MGVLLEEEACPEEEGVAFQEEVASREEAEGACLEGAAEVVEGSVRVPVPHSEAVLP